MRVCSSCGKGWPEDHAACPEDGTRLGPPSYMTVGSLAPAASRSPYDEELAPGSQAGEYRIENKIGEGGMGAVYGAKHPVIGKRAAIKVIRRELSSNPEAVDRFVREAQAVNTIGHPNIVDVFSFGVLPDGRSFFVMEWLQGESLRQRLERPLTYAEAIEIIDTIAKALHAAHDAGVVHRDLKPDNVFLSAIKDEKPVVMLLDFGLAKLTSADGRIEQTRTGIVMGTPLYISPEQAKGAKVGPGTDIYALGVMAFEMFSGRVPFLADSAVEIMSLHITQQPPPPSHVSPTLPAAVDALVLAMLSKDPEKRPTLPQIRKQLADLKGLTSSISPVGIAVAPGTWPAPLPPAPPLSPTRISGVASEPPAVGSPLATMPPVAPGRKRRTGLVIGVGLAGGVVALVLIVALGKARSTPSTPAPADKVAATEPVKPEPVKPEPVKPEPAATEPVKPEPVRPEPVKPEPVKPEPVKPELVKPEPVKPEPVKPEPVKVDPVGGDSSKRPGKVGTVNITIAGAPRATVFVDGRIAARGVVQLTLTLAPGDHAIRAESPRHKGADTMVHVDGGSQRAVRLVLKKAGGGVNAVEDPFAP